jgi:transposase-like protein
LKKTAKHYITAFKNRRKVGRPTWASKHPTKAEALVTLVKNEGHSISSVARFLGVSYQTAQNTLNRSK